MQKRSQRNKHITINPGQTCDICFGSVFDKREFFVFPCLHAFHRECMRAFLQDYTPKDPKLRSVIEIINQSYAEIDKIKMGYLHMDEDAAAAGGSIGGRPTISGAQD